MNLRILFSTLLAILATVALTSTLGAATFTPEADAYVNAAKPTKNYGNATSLRPDGSPERNAYVRFDVSSANPSPTASLRFYASSNHSVGLDVRVVADTSWGETAINYMNAPAFGPIVGSTGPLQAGNWYIVDVSAQVAGNGPVGFALTTPGSSSAKISSREGVNPPELIVPAVPSSSPFLVSRINATTYRAESQATPTTYTGSLKFVVESAVLLLDQTGGGAINFTGGQFDFGSDHFEFDEIADIDFRGQGIDVTVLSNNSSASTDTEPFDFVGADRVTIRDLTVDAGGPFRSTSDAIDFDLGNDVIVERVKVANSRGRGIVFDGNVPGRSADRNIVRDCIIDGIPSDGIELLASNDNLVENCTITNVGGNGIQITKSSPSASDPNRKSNDNEIRNNTIDQAGRDGVNVISSDRNVLDDNVITNSSDVTANRDGIRIMSTHSIGCDDNVVDDNTATDTQTPKTQRYGLSISSALCNRTFVEDNDFGGNKVGEINDLGTDTVIVSEPGAPFVPVADAYVNSSKPTRNYGSSTLLRTDASPAIRSYLRFNIQGLTEPVIEATLRVFAQTGNPVGFDVHGVGDNTWAELGITYLNSPAFGPVLASSGSFSPGGYVDVDVTGLVTGNGLLSLAMTSPSSTAVRYSSRQSANQPELIVAVASAGPSPGPLAATSLPATLPWSSSPTRLARQAAFFLPAAPPRIRHVRVG